jgi:hypothetical protein
MTVSDINDKDIGWWRPVMASSSAAENTRAQPSTHPH